jgi:hypothetical protein
MQERDQLEVIIRIDDVSEREWGLLGFIYEFQCTEYILIHFYVFNVECCSLIKFVPIICSVYLYVTHTPFLFFLQLCHRDVYNKRTSSRS